MFHYPIPSQPYQIISTGARTGLVQTLTDTQSLDGLKKRYGFINLRNHFEKTYSGTGRQLKEAQRNFLRSLAAYSLICYVLQVKDRHNGNILLSSDGHIIHIDFGWLLGIAPGGSFSLESSPFKVSLGVLMLRQINNLTSHYISIHLLCVALLLLGCWPPYIADCRVCGCSWRP